MKPFMKISAFLLIFALLSMFAFISFQRLILLGASQSFMYLLWFLQPS